MGLFVFIIDNIAYVKKIERERERGNKRNKKNEKEIRVKSNSKK